MNLVDHLGDRVDLWFVTGDTDYTATEPYPGIVPDQWTTLPTGPVLAQAAASTVRARISAKGPAAQAAIAAGLDPVLLYDYR